MDKSAGVSLNLIRKIVDENCSADQQLLTHANWKVVMDFCLSQGVAGICFEAFEMLEKTCRPPKFLLMEWYGKVKLHEYFYKQHKEALEHLAQFYSREGVRMLLLKGYGLSLFWPTPEHRPVGDIDCYNFGQQKHADKRISEEYGITIDNSHHKHSVFKFEDTMVENHYSFLNVHGHRSTAEIERILEGEVKEGCTEDRELKNVWYPSVRFNSLYLLRHSAEHFASVDINLRQVLDWGFFVRANKMDWDWLLCRLEQMGMRRYLAVLNAICVRHLGFDASLFPVLEIDERLVERCLNDILSPEFQKERHRNALAEIAYRFKRWNANRWKHDMVYKESIWQSFCSQVWSHVLKPSL